MSSTFPASPLALDQAQDPEFWRSLQPGLTVGEQRGPAPFDVGDTRALLERLRFEGYVYVPGVVPPTTFGPLLECVRRLHERGIPLPFAFMYDEFWEMYRSTSAFVRGILGDGYWMLPAFWVWYLPPTDDASGWGPHRDRRQCMVDDDNSPRTITVWLALSDATPLNGCIYVLPANLDPAFASRVWDDSGSATYPLQDMRAVPAPAGTLLAWNQNLLHWGGRASRFAASPRCSAALEFQRGDQPTVLAPLIDANWTPTFSQRLGLVAKQILQYKHMYPLSPDMAEVARQLWEPFVAEFNRQGQPG